MKYFLIIVWLLLLFVCCIKLHLKSVKTYMQNFKTIVTVKENAIKFWACKNFII